MQEENVKKQGSVFLKEARSHDALTEAFKSSSLLDLDDGEFILKNGKFT